MSQDIERYAARAEELSEGGKYEWWAGLAAILRSQATLTAERDALAKALEPFADDKLPGNNRDIVEYDRHGLRRLMSPMEVARRNAFFALHPDKHPLRRAALSRSEV